MITLTLTAQTRTIRERLYTFCKVHPHIIFFLDTMGPWDFELRLEVENMAQASDTCDEIQQQFGDKLLNIELIPVLERFKSAGLPLAEK